MSDIHFGGEDALALEAASAYARAARFDLLVVSGDLTQYGQPVEFRRAGEWLNGLPTPRLATPGNHDTPWMGLKDRLLRPFQSYENAIGPPAEDGFETEGLVARAINSARGWQIRLNWSKGEIDRRQVERVAGQFAAAPPGAVRVLACHHPLVEAIGEPMTARVRGGDHAARRMNAAAVDIVLTGHLHAPFVQALPHGDSMTYAVGAGTLSLRERGSPPGFNVIDIADGEITVTALAWTGKDLTTDRVWAVPLRPRP